MEEPAHISPESASSSSTSNNGGPSGAATSSSSSSLPSSSHVQEEEHVQHQEHEQQQTSVSYHVNISISDIPSSGIRDDAWSCLVVLVTFWFFASMTLIMGFYGSVNLQLGPNCSRLLQANSLLVQYIKVQEVGESKTGPILYGFYGTPPLNVETTWSESHNASVPANVHKARRPFPTNRFFIYQIKFLILLQEWIYFLNEGSQLEISYSVKSQSSSPISLVIAQDRESLVEWIEDPLYPNTTLSWNIIHGKGTIQQEIYKSSSYYVALSNLNLEEVEVQLNLRIRAFLYNTTEAFYKCSLNHGICSLKLFLMGSNAAVLTSPGPEQGTPSDDWYVKLSYGPRWISYFVGSGGMTVLILLAFKFCNNYQSTSGEGTGFQSEEVTSEQTPLLSHKDDDLSSWGSSYESVSHDEEDLEDWLAVSSLEGKPLKDGENYNNPRRLCAICFDTPRDCFFLPCGHCAACFTCGTRIAEEAGTCPICRRKMKKVRKIFTV
ncbi:hypothetical protein HHK36_010742 [Tetracentron sinense]|uniref:RING-type domain-containing protein n=1 Tax=Tetracentron sinense TaxID=13715 RepID=A0A834ZCG8_TETSI|nr:hypothetical protein HHK36_010742 [Tetracentron sinense]